MGVDGDSLDAFFVKGYYKELGYAGGDICWWKVPWLSLEGGLRKLETDKDLLKMCKTYRRNHNIMNIFFEHGVSELHVVECMSEDDEVILPKNASLMKLPCTQPTMQATINPTKKCNSQPTQKPKFQPNYSQPAKSCTDPLKPAVKLRSGHQPPKKSHAQNKNKEPLQFTRSSRVVKPSLIQDDSDSRDSYESTEDSLYKSTKVLGDLSDTDSGNDDFNSRGPRKTDFREKHRPTSFRGTEKVIDTDDSSYEDIKEDEPSDFGKS
ncbi:hypothetical protein Ahy_B06g080997 [Arachis hypogaea]|uniref:PB1-like domain-containing protein n=1 Tax=Arachis hypogaea TaxID=3818 RepID=A0A444YJT9_ARAHY|nr:hypothetical protein Ahy_B06g080997 [Arachis hypogaea]